MSPTIKIGIILLLLAAGGFGIATAIGMVQFEVAMELFLRTGAAIAILTVVSLAIGSVAGSSAKAE